MRSAERPQHASTHARTHARSGAQLAVCTALHCTALEHSASCWSGHVMCMCHVPVQVREYTWMSEWSMCVSARVRANDVRVRLQPRSGQRSGRDTALAVGPTIAAGNTAQVHAAFQRGFKKKLKENESGPTKKDGPLPPMYVSERPTTRNGVAHARRPGALLYGTALSALYGNTAMHRLYVACSQSVSRSRGRSRTCCSLSLAPEGITNVLYICARRVPGRPG